MKTVPKMMMMTMSRKISLFVLLIIFSLKASSQEKDFGIWYNASVSFDIVKRLDADISTSFRTFDNAGRLEEGFIESELSYKFNNYLAAAASYRISENIEDDDSYHIRHKWFVTFQGTLPVGNLKVSARCIFQQRYKTYFEDENDKLPRSHGRFRFKAQYDFPELPVDPYLYGEMFCPLFRDSERIFDKKRAGAGVKITITSRHALQVGYIFQRDYFPDVIDENILILGYSLKL